jgi:hypothetical protein
MKKYILLTLLVTNSCFAQILNITGDLKTHVDDIISNMPVTAGTDEYHNPTNTQIDTWNQIIDNMVGNNMNAAAMLTAGIDYQIVNFTDNSEFPSVNYFILEKTNSGTNYWGTYIFNTFSCRPDLIIQSPHEGFDFNTGKQGFHIFKKLRAYAFFLNGTDRCNASQEVACSGTTTVCGHSKFMLSDVVHNDTAAFYLATARILLPHPNMNIVQLHGFTRQSGDPHVIISNGTNLTPSIIDYAIKFRDELSAIIDTMEFKIGHIDNPVSGENWDRLLANTNVVGRLINGSVNHCTANSSSVTGRFLHIEQIKVGLRDNSTNWDKVADALSKTYASICIVLPVKLQSFSGFSYNEIVKLKWTTSSEQNTKSIQIQRSKDGNFEDIETISAQGNKNTPTTYEFYDFQPNWGINLYRLKFIDKDGNTEYSFIIKINVSTANKTKIYPTPAKNILNIDTNKSFTASLFSMEGQNLLTQTNKKNIFLDNLSNGVYILKISYPQNITESFKINIVK